MSDGDKMTIGPAEPVSFPTHNLFNVAARIDTGAKTSAIWASEISKKGDRLHVVLFGPSSKHYTGEELILEHFQKTLISTSTGEVEQRYKVRLVVHLAGRRVQAFFTLADRSQQVYPVLIGRNVLLGKFVVDVKERNKDLRTEKNQREIAREKFEAAHHEEEK